MLLSFLYLVRVEGGELFDRVVDVGKFSKRIAKLLFYQMLVAVKVGKSLWLWVAFRRCRGCNGSSLSCSAVSPRQGHHSQGPEGTISLDSLSQ